MREKVQIIDFARDEKFQSNFKECPDQNTGLNFSWFKLGETRDPNLLKHGATQCIEYYNGHKWKLITGLIPLKFIKNVYFGDIDSNTAAIWLHPENDIISMAIFHGHRPKFRSAREKKIMNFLRGLKNKG